MQDSNFQVVIPARQGSKRFPGKNMATLCGKPLIQYSIDYALKYFSRESIWVNSDDRDVINFSSELGVRTIMRPSDLAKDESPTVDVLKFQLHHFKQTNMDCDSIILLQPTNPIRPDYLLGKAIKKYVDSGRNSLATFSTIESKFGNIINDTYEPINYVPGQRSQDLKKIYSENGLIYISKSNSILEGKIITDDVYPLVCDQKGADVDIDYEDDLLYAEYLIN